MTTLDLRDERGRSLTKVRISRGLFYRLRLLADLKDTTLEELVHQTLEAKARAVIP